MKHDKDTDVACKMRSLQRALAGAVLLVIASGASVAGAGPLVNSDFETGDLSGWTWQPTPHSDPSMVADVVSFNTLESQSSFAFHVNPGGDQTFLSGSSGGGTLSQNVFLNGGTTYQISMEVAEQSVESLLNLSSGFVIFQINGESISGFGPGEIPGNTVFRNTVTGSYTPLDSGEYTAAVVFNRQYGNGPTPVVYDYVDNISLVPEPTAACLLGVTGMCLFNCRRKTAGSRRPKEMLDPRLH